MHYQLGLVVLLAALSGCGEAKSNSYPAANSRTTTSDAATRPPLDAPVNANYDTASSIAISYFMALQQRDAETLSRLFDPDQMKKMADSIPQDPEQYRRAVAASHANYFRSDKTFAVHSFQVINVEEFQADEVAVHVEVDKTLGGQRYTDRVTVLCVNRKGKWYVDPYSVN